MYQFIYSRSQNICSLFGFHWFLAPLMLQVTRINVPEIILSYFISTLFSEILFAVCLRRREISSWMQDSQRTCLKFLGRLSSFQYGTITSCIHSTLIPFTLYSGPTTSGCKQDRYQCPSSQDSWGSTEPHNSYTVQPCCK